MVRNALLGFTCVALAACSPAGPKLSVHDGWARETGQAGTAAAYLTIDNKGGADRLTGVRSSIGQATLHESSMAGGVMRMRPIDAKGMVVPSNGSLKLAPGGAHVMVMGLKKPLHAGDRFDVTLLFGQSGPQQVAIAVKPANSAPAGH